MEIPFKENHFFTTLFINISIIINKHKNLKTLSLLLY